MPCWEVRTMSVEFQAKHRKLLEQAVLALGWMWESVDGGIRVFDPKRRGSFTIDHVTQSAEILETQQSALNQLKRQYSKEALRRAAKLQGWQFKTTAQTKGVLRR